MTGGLPPFVWVTLGQRQGAEHYHRRAGYHLQRDARRVPTIEAAAIRVGLTLCAHCARPDASRIHLERSSSEALAEFAGSLRSA